MALKQTYQLNLRHEGKQNSRRVVAYTVDDAIDRVLQELPGAQVHAVWQLVLRPARYRGRSARHLRETSER